MDSAVLLNIAGLNQVSLSEFAADQVADGLARIAQIENKIHEKLANFENSEITDYVQSGTQISQLKTRLLMHVGKFIVQ